MYRKYTHDPREHVNEATSHSTKNYFSIIYQRLHPLLCIAVSLLCTAQIYMYTILYNRETFSIQKNIIL